MTRRERLAWAALFTFFSVRYWFGWTEPMDDGQMSGHLMLIFAVVALRR